MKNLLELYKLVEDFAGRHRMVNEFKVIGDIQELDQLDLDFRSLVLVIDNTNISRELNYYSLGFNVYIVDKCQTDNPEGMVVSTQENIFVISQLQDYILQQDNVVEFEQVEIANARNDDYTTTVAFCAFNVHFERTTRSGDCFEGTVALQDINLGE